MNFAEAAYFTDFGVPATLDGAPVRGIFDNAYGESFGLVASSSPVFRLPSSIAVATGQTLIIAATTYTVAGIEPDGTGLTVLRLEKA